MIINNYINVIKNSKLFLGISEDEILSLLNCLSPKIITFEKNEFIVNIGDEIRNFGLILEGEAIIIKEKADGNRVVMSVVKKGDMFGEMFVFSSKRTWPVSVKTQSSRKILFFTNSDLITRCGRNCSWHVGLLRNFITLISDKSLTLNKKVEYLTIKSVRGKLCSYLYEQYRQSKNSTIILPLNRNELADFLNVSRPSLSREICQLRDEGVIDFHLSTFKIKNIEKLISYCDC